MSTPGLQWSQLIGNMLNEGTNQVQAGARIGQGQQQIDIEKQDQQNRQRQADAEFHEHMTQLGATPVYQGMVKDTHQLPSVPSPAGALGLPTGDDIPGPTVTTVRKVDPARFVKVSGADGNSGYELPSYADQIKNQVQAQAPARAAQVQQEQDTSRAQALGAGQGKTQADTAARNAIGIPVSDELADQYGIPKGQKLLPPELLSLTQHYNTVRGADIRTQGLLTREQMRNNANAAAQKLQNDFTDQQNQRKSEDQDRWRAARNVIAGNTQTSLNDRALLRQADSAQQQHGKLLDQMYKEGLKQFDAQALIDPNGGMEDGKEFTDPWSGKKMTYNYAQGLRLKNALGASQAQVADWQGRASDIEQRFHLPPRGGAAPGGAAPSGSGAGTPPSASVAPANGSPTTPTPGAPTTRPANWADAARAATGPSAALPGRSAPQGGSAAAPAKPQAKVANQAQVQAYAKTKNIPPDQAMKEFKSAGYTVQ